LHRRYAASIAPIIGTEGRRMTATSVEVKEAKAAGGAKRKGAK